MSHDFANDPRFTEIPAHFQEQIKEVPPTGERDDVYYHEVQFIMGAEIFTALVDDVPVQYVMGGIMCQCAVVMGKYVPLPKEEVNQFQVILKIWSKEDLNK